MLQALVSKANRLWHDLHRSLFRPKPVAPVPREPDRYAPLKRVLLTDGVAHTLFESYARHRSAEHGDEETGWVLLGLRHADEAIALATLPAGAGSDAGVAHVRFNSDGQAFASRIVRQMDRRLTILGVVHTHPGTLRHPSQGDLHGDSQWVRHLRGREGVFAIGTANAPEDAGSLFAWQPKSNVQCWGALRFSWYALGEYDTGYRTLPVEMTMGPDLARSLHPIWPVIEAHALRADRLYRQQTGVRFEVADEGEPGLILHLPLADKGDAVRILLREKDVRYFVIRGGQTFAVDHADPLVDRGVYLLLAELAGQT